MINSKIQTDLLFLTETEVNQQVENHTGINIGVNTSFEIESKTVKIVADPFEENRLKDNIVFWKDKVDLLFKEKKETLSTQMA